MKASALSSRHKTYKLTPCSSELLPSPGEAFPLCVPHCHNQAGHSRSPNSTEKDPQPRYNA